jgi:hypothetical protein
MVVLGLVATVGVLSCKGIVEVSDESNRCELPRLSQSSQPWFPMPPLWEQEALDARARIASSLSDIGHLVSSGLALDVTRFSFDVPVRVAAERVVAVEVDQGIHEVAPAAQEDAALGVAGGENQGLGPTWTATVTVYSCLNDTTGAYACDPGVPAGACGYVLNPGAEGPGVTEPSLYVAAGPSWPCGTEFLLATGQRVIVADRGGMVHDRHLDAYCFDAKNRETCLPGIGASVGVKVLE